MAQPINCELCNSEPAVMMQMNLTDGSSISVGAGCIPVFLVGAVSGVTGAGEHKNTPGKCPACKITHDQMTPAPAAPAAAEPNPVPTGQLEALITATMIEAGAAGIPEMVTLCEAALSGDPDAINAVVEIINGAPTAPEQAEVTR